MSTPYLNRGESIVMTTHRVSVGSIIYDAMLTTERLILMDNRYTRFEPRMIHFPAIISVKGGKVPTGEPAIILTLDEPSDLSGSNQVNLIFSQEPGEPRTHERELWVKKLIGLVIIAREQAAQKKIVPVRKKTGMQPSVRRWVAPEPLRPHSSVIKPSSRPQPVVVISEEPDSLEFFLEEQPHEGPEPPEEESNGMQPVPEILPASGETAGESEEEMETHKPVTIAEAQPEEPAPAREMPARDDQISRDEMSGAEPFMSQENTPVESEHAAISGSPVFPEPAEDNGPSVSFASTVLAATQSLKSRADSPKQPEGDRPTLPEPSSPAQNAVAELPAHGTLPAEKPDGIEEQNIKKINPLPDPGLHKEPSAIPDSRHKEAGERIARNIFTRYSRNRHRHRTTGNRAAGPNHRFTKKRAGFPCRKTGYYLWGSSPRRPARAGRGDNIHLTLPVSPGQQPDGDNHSRDHGYAGPVSRSGDSPSNGGTRKCDLHRSFRRHNWEPGLPSPGIRYGQPHVPGPDGQQYHPGHDPEAG